MSDLLAKYDELFDLENGIRNQMALWREQMSAINQATETLIGTDNMKGKTADNMRDYFTGVYGTIQAVSERIMTSFVYNCGIYRNDYSKIDNDDHFVISTSELKSINKRLSHEAGEKEFVEQTVSSIVASVSDISSATFGGFGYIGSAHADLDTFLTTLGTQITDLENTHQQQDFVDLEEGINALQSLINDMSGKETIYKLNFDVATFASSEAYRRLGQIYNNLTDNLQNKQEEFNDAEAARAQHIEVLKAEEEARKKQAETAKTVVMGLCIIGGVAATVLTAGAASPILVGTISGAVTGGIMAGVNTTADMYAAGGWDNVEWGKVGKEVLVGSITGAATGFVSSYVGGAFQGGNFGKVFSGSGFKTYVGKAISGSVTKVATGFTDRLVSTSVRDVLDGKDMKTAFKDSTKNAFDLKSMLGDGVAGSTKAITSSLTKTGVDKIMEKTGASSVIGKGDFLKYGYATTCGSMSEVTGGFNSRFLSELAKGNGIEKAWESATNKRSIFTDAIGGGSGALGKELIRDREVPITNRLKKDMRGEAQENAIEKSKKYNDTYGKNAVKKIEEMTGVTGVERTKSGNLDYTGTGKIVTVNGKPAIVRVELSGDDNIDCKNATKIYKAELGEDCDWEKSDDTVWHHSKDLIIWKDGKAYSEMQLIPDEIHNYYFKHSGTNSQYKYYNEQLDELHDKYMQKTQDQLVDAAKKSAMNNKNAGDKPEKKVWDVSIWDLNSSQVAMPVF